MFSLYDRDVFFFFQAEDGIRDLTVTGVQTCALPISLGFGSHRPPLSGIGERGGGPETLGGANLRRLGYDSNGRQDRIAQCRRRGGGPLRPGGPAEAAKNPNSFT